MALDIGSAVLAALGISSLFGNSGLSKSLGGLTGSGGGMLIPSTGAVVGAAADALGSLLPQKSEYSGDKGGITQSLDGVYDTASNVAMNFGPIGAAIGGGMKAAKLIGLGVNALGGGTDGMTGTDAILGSSFLNLTPMGIINGFGGKRAETITKDTEAFASTGSSYSGSEGVVDNATNYSGKKYGLFSSGARKKANNLIREASRLQAMVGDIGQQSKMTNELLANQSSMATEASAFEQAGGYDATATRAAKQGMKITLSNINKIKNILNPNKIEEIPQFKEGNKIDIHTIAVPKKLSNAIKLAKLGAVITPKEKPINYNFETSEVTDDMIASLIGTQIFKNGGNVETKLDKEPQTSDLPNLIPEGALHKNKHHMENDEDITKKGIPVVVEEKDGSLNQLAEIERDEIIINKELTDKIEKYLKEYNSEDKSKSEKELIAIEAGKILATELMTNTDDRTGLMETI